MPGRQLILNNAVIESLLPRLGENQRVRVLFGKVAAVVYSYIDQWPIGSAGAQLD